MGVVVGPALLALHEELEGEQYEGVKILARSVTVGEALAFGEFMDGLHIAPVMTAEQVEKRDRSYEMLAGKLAEWNLESAPGVPLPLTLEGIRALDWTWGRDLVRAWVRCVSGVSGPLERPSGDTPPLEVASIPMEPLSKNPGN